MSRYILASLIALLAIVGTSRAQSVDDQAIVTRARLAENLKKWQALSPQEREQYRAQIKERLTPKANPERQKLLEKAARFGDLSTEDRERLRERVAEMRARMALPEFRKQLQERRERIHRMPPLERKRAMVLRQLFESLPRAELESIKSAPADARKKRVRELLGSEGPKIIEGQLRARNPQLAQRFAAKPLDERQRIFKAWMSSPDPSLARFFRQRRR